MDEGENLWHVTYRDFDEEDLNLEQLAKTLIYHPGLASAGEVTLPEVDTMVWFAQNQRPQLGKVEAVDPTYGHTPHCSEVLRTT